MSVRPVNVRQRRPDLIKPTSPGVVPKWCGFRKGGLYYTKPTRPYNFIARQIEVG